MKAAGALNKGESQRGSCYAAYVSVSTGPASHKAVNVPVSLVAATATHGSLTSAEAGLISASSERPRWRNW